jgi:hypothetical protein
MIGSCGILLTENLHLERFDKGFGRALDISRCSDKPGLYFRKVFGLQTFRPIYHNLRECTSRVRWLSPFRVPALSFALNAGSFEKTPALNEMGLRARPNRPAFPLREISANAS